MSSTHVSVRLSSDVWTRYSAEAQARGVALGTYLRQRLEQQDRLVAELAIRAAAEQSASSREPLESTGSTADSGTLVEVLLILRSLAGPQKSAVAQKEVERRGLSPWR
jgi:hypothetical protein